MGIWFYEEAEADKVETLLQRILAAYPSAAALQPQVSMIHVAAPTRPARDLAFGMHQLQNMLAPPKAQ
jgi:hypothetical protein